MVRFIIGGFAVALLALAGGATAAPVPKDASKPDPAPDLKAAFDAIGKAVKDEKWPKEEDEKVLRGTAEKVFERALKAADLKDRKLPVAFDKLTKADVVAKYGETSLDGGFVVAGDVRITSAKNSVIFASGDVQITSATNCVIVAKNVRCTGVDNCTVIAGEFIRVTSARRRDGGDGSVLVAGQWIGATGLDGTVCHVLRPGKLPPPDMAKFAGNQPHPAIRSTSAKGVIYLNERADTGSTGDANEQTYLPQKNPIAK